MKAIKAKKAVDDGKIPCTIETLYKWHNKNKYPGLLFKVSGFLMIDIDQWKKIAKEAKEENIKRSQTKNNEG